jgi:class 3 adenylate cyclase
MKLLRGAAGDREQALELINASLERAQSLGMKPLLENAIARKLDAQGSASGTFHAQHSIDIVAHRVDRERPDLSATAAPDGTVTLVFSDMEGFTAMTERLGDLRAREVIRAHNRIVRVQVAAHGGYEVELQGDGFLLAFGSARRALHCAIAIQRAMAAHSAEHPEEPLRVRIGLHTGEALREADKFFGRTVILAARIAAQALGGEILASAVIHELARSGGDVCFGDRRLLELKGIAEPQSVYEVDWTTGRRCFRGCPARPLPSRTRPMARLGWLRIARRHSPTGAERHRMRRDPSRTVSKEPAPPVGWGEWAHSLKLVRMLVSHRIRFRPTTEAPPLAGVRVRP